MTWKAASDRVVVQVQEQAKQTAAGILLPDRVKGNKIGFGVVLAAGPQAQGILPGDSISYQVAGAHEVQEGVVSLNVDYILAIQRAD